MKNLSTLFYCFCLTLFAGQLWSQNVQLTYPLTAEFWFAGDSKQITWNYFGSESGTVQLQKGFGGWWENVGSPINVQAGSLFINAVGPFESSQFGQTQYRLVASYDNGTNETSNLSAEISIGGAEVFAGPGGTILLAGSDATLGWRPYLLAENQVTASIEFSSNAGSTWELVKEVTPGANGLLIEEDWVVPSVDSENCLLRVVTTHNGETRYWNSFHSFRVVTTNPIDEDVTVLGVMGSTSITEGGIFSVQPGGFNYQSNVFSITESASNKLSRIDDDVFYFSNGVTFDVRLIKVNIGGSTPPATVNAGQGSAENFTNIQRVNNKLYALSAGGYDGMLGGYLTPTGYAFNPANLNNPPTLLDLPSTIISPEVTSPNFSNLVEYSGKVYSVFYDNASTQVFGLVEINGANDEVSFIANEEYGNVWYFSNPVVTNNKLWFLCVADGTSYLANYDFLQENWNFDEVNFGYNNWIDISTDIVVVNNALYFGYSTQGDLGKLSKIDLTTKQVSTIHEFPVSQLFSGSLTLGPNNRIYGTVTQTFTYESSIFMLNPQNDEVSEGHSFYQSWGSRVISNLIILPGTVVASIDEHELLTETVTFYPNPTSGQLNYRLCENCEVSSLVILDVQGKVVYRVDQPQSQGTIELPNYIGNGYYFVQYLQNSEMQTQKFILNR